MRTRTRWVPDPCLAAIVVVCLSAGLFLLAPADQASALEPEAEPFELQIGFGPRAFIGVNETDAIAAYSVFTRSVAREMGYELDLSLHSFDTDEALAVAIESQSLHYVVIDTLQYLSLGLQEHVEPSFIASQSGYGVREYLLLVRADAPYQDLRDLRGKDVILLESVNCLLSEFWLKTLLLEEGIGHEKAFLGSLKLQSKATKVVLPVFFGNADACVVNRPVFDTMRDLNPQLGQRLRALVVSEPLIGGMICLARHGWTSPRHRRDLVDVLGSLHSKPDGRQILNLFKTERLLTFEDRFIGGTRALKAKHDRLLRDLEGR